MQEPQLMLTAGPAYQYATPQYAPNMPPYGAAAPSNMPYQNYGNFHIKNIKKNQIKCVLLS